jgi:hypothetical protein
VLFFGSSLWVLVAEANTIGRTYLRRRPLAEPVRPDSPGLLRGCTDVGIALTAAVPGTPEHRGAIADSEGGQRRLWALAARALEEAPEANAPRRYVDSLKRMFDAQTDRLYGLGNRVRTAVRSWRWPARPSQSLRWPSVWPPSVARSPPCWSRPCW